MDTEKMTEDQVRMRFEMAIGLPVKSENESESNIQEEQKND